MNTNDTKEIRILFGKTVRNERRRQGITQQVFAVMIGSSQTYVSALESGEYNVKIDMIYKIAAALGMSAQDLIP